MAIPCETWNTTHTALVKGVLNTSWQSDPQSYMRDEYLQVRNNSQTEPQAESRLLKLW